MKKTKIFIQFSNLYFFFFLKNMLIFMKNYYFKIIKQNNQLQINKTQEINNNDI